MKRHMQALELHDDGYDNEHIARIMGVSKGTVGKYLTSAYVHAGRTRSEGRIPPKPGFKANGNDPIQTRRGKAQYLFRALGFTVPEIATKMAISEVTVKRYLQKASALEPLEYENSLYKPKYIRDEPDKIEDMIQYKDRRGIWRWKQAA